MNFFARKVCFKLDELSFERGEYKFESLLDSELFSRSRERLLLFAYKLSFFLKLNFDSFVDPGRREANSRGFF